jgi:hypothetical protein
MTVDELAFWFLVGGVAVYAIYRGTMEPQEGENDDHDFD